MSDVSDEDLIYGSAPDSRLPVDLGYELADAKRRLANLRYGDVMEWLLHLLSFEDTPAYLGLGVYYWKGFGVVEPNENKAFFWTDLAARQVFKLARISDVEVRDVARTQLAYFLLQGIGQRPDYRQAEHLLVEASNAPAGIGTDAQFLLAYYRVHAAGIERWKQQDAVRLLQGLVKSGYADAMELLARCYREGTGIEPDSDRADELDDEVTAARSRAKTSSSGGLKEITAWFPMKPSFTELDEDGPTVSPPGGSAQWIRDFTPAWAPAIRHNSSGIAVAEQEVVLDVALLPDTREDSGATRKPEPRRGVSPNKERFPAATAEAYAKHIESSLPVEEQVKLAISLAERLGVQPEVPNLAAADISPSTLAELDQKREQLVAALAKAEVFGGAEPSLEGFRQYLKRQRSRGDTTYDEKKVICQIVNFWKEHLRLDLIYNGIPCVLAPKTPSGDQGGYHLRRAGQAPKKGKKSLYARLEFPPLDCRIRSE